MKRLKSLAVISSLLLFGAAGIAQAEMAAIYGPVYITKAKGHEDDVKLSFTAPVPGSGVIVIKNGADSGKKHRVSQAELELNGQDVARPRDFNKKAEVIEYNVQLLANNELEVEVESCRQCKIEITVLGEKPAPPELPTRDLFFPTR